jgi:hypothetical protein
MTPYEYFDLAISLSSRIDGHWTLFITVHLALIGGIIYVDRPLLKNEKAVALIIYTGFAVINLLMMINQTQFLGTIYQEIYKLKDMACCINNETIKYVVELHKHDSKAIALYSIVASHIGMYILLTLSIFYDKSLHKKVSTES